MDFNDFLTNVCMDLADFLVTLGYSQDQAEEISYCYDQDLAIPFGASDDVIEWLDKYVYMNYLGV